MRKRLYFAYGSNLHLERMLQRCPDAEPLTQGILRGYELTFKGNSRGWGVADIVPASPSSVVFGAIYKVSARDIESLDLYEGYPRLYTRKTVTVETREGKRKCFVYVMQPGYKYALPNMHYFRTIWVGYQNWALPAEYLTDAVKRTNKKLSKISVENFSETSCNLQRSIS